MGGPLLKSRGLSKSRSIKVTIPDLRLVLALLCFTSFILTFLYIDTVDEAEVAASEGRFTKENSYAVDTTLDEPEDRRQEDVDIEEEENIMAQEEDEGISEPEVLTIQPFHGPTIGGVVLTIHGHNLKGSGGYGDPVASIGGVPCSATEVVEEEELTCVTPPGVGARMSVRVTLHRGEELVRRDLPETLSSKDNTLFSYDEPEVDSVLPDHGQTNGGTYITISGSNFGLPEVSSEVEASVGGSPCVQLEHLSDKQAICVTPVGSAGSKSVTLTVGSGEHKAESRRNNLFSYVMTPEERLAQEAGSLLDGLTVRYDPSMSSLVMNARALASNPHEFHHRDAFSGKGNLYSVPPDLLAVLPAEEFTKQYGSCAVVGNSGILLESSHGLAINSADAVFRFNNAPTEGFESHVGSNTQFRVAETRFLRSLLTRDPNRRQKVWKPSSKQTLLVWSEYAQDLYVQVSRMYQRISIYYMSRQLVGDVQTLYQELRRRFEDLGVSSTLASDAQLMGADEGASRSAPGNATGGLGGAGGRGGASSMRRLLQTQKAFSIHNVPELQGEDWGAGVEPRSAGDIPPVEFITVMFALQVCKHVDVYGFEQFTGGLKSVIRTGPYYPIGAGEVFGIDDDSEDPETASINAAIMELLKIQGYINMHY